MELDFHTESTVFFLFKNYWIDIFYAFPIFYPYLIGKKPFNHFFVGVFVFTILYYSKFYVRRCDWLNELDYGAAAFSLSYRRRNEFLC